MDSSAVLKNALLSAFTGILSFQHQEYIPKSTPSSFSQITSIPFSPAGDTLRLLIFSILPAMRLFRRLASLLGLNKDDADESIDDDLVDGASAPTTTTPQHYGPRRGFSVPVQVAVERPTLGPLLVPCVFGDGGVQGFKWFAKRQRIDEDGDVADEFVNEILPDESSRVEEEHHRQLPRFEAKHGTKPFNISNIRSVDGKIQLESKDRLVWL